MPHKTLNERKIKSFNFIKYLIIMGFLYTILQVIKFCIIGANDYLKTGTTAYLQIIWLEPVKVSNIFSLSVKSEQLLSTFYIQGFFYLLPLLICGYVIWWICKSIKHCIKANSMKELIIPVISMLSWISAWYILNYVRHVVNLDIKLFLMETLNSSIIVEVYAILLTVGVIYSSKILIEKCILSSNTVGRFFVNRVCGNK